MITGEEQQDIKAKKKRRKSDWLTLVEELSQRGGYIDRAIIADPRERRRRRRRGDC